MTFNDNPVINTKSNRLQSLPRNSIINVESPKSLPNTIPTAKNVKLTYNSRKIGHVTALDVYIEAEPGEYAFIIRDPEVEKYVKELDASQDKGFYDFDISVLTEGAFFFTIK